MTTIFCETFTHWYLKPHSHYGFCRHSYLGMPTKHKKCLPHLPDFNPMKKSNNKNNIVKMSLKNVEEGTDHIVNEFLENVALSVKGDGDHILRKGHNFLDNCALLVQTTKPCLSL